MNRPLVVWVALGLAVAGLWTFDHTSHAVEIASLTRVTQSLDSALHASLAARKAQERVDSALSDSVALLRHQGAVVGIRVDTLQVRVVAAESVFVAELPDSLKLRFAALSALHDSIVASLKLQTADLTAALDAQNQQLAIRAVTIHSLEVDLKEALKQRDDWRRAAQPPLALRIIRGIPQAAVAAAVVLILRR